MFKGTFETTESTLWNAESREYLYQFMYPLGDFLFKILNSDIAKVCLK